MVCVFPVSSTPGEGALYPKLSVAQSGLRKESFALIDQMRSLDKQRLRRRYGCISRSELQALDEGIRLYLSL
jgi:mRNA-degrading endonuclease toxin of MazEF toxin-antitoxin module